MSVLLLSAIVIVVLCVVGAAGIHYAPAIMAHYSKPRRIMREIEDKRREIQKAERVMAIMGKDNYNYGRWRNIAKWRTEELEQLEQDLEEYFILEAEKKMLEE